MNMFNLDNHNMDLVTVGRILWRSLPKLWNHSQSKGVYILDSRVFELELVHNLKVALEGKSLLKYLNKNSQFVGSKKGFHLYKSLAVFALTKFGYLCHQPGLIAAEIHLFSV